MVKKAISQMTVGKAPDPSGIVVEMIRAAGDMGASMICECNHSRWQGTLQLGAVSLSASTRDALERGNYYGLKLTEQVMRVLERIVDGLIRQLVSIDNSQFGFVPGRGTRDAIFVVTSEGHLVGAEKTWCGGVACTTGAGDVCKCAVTCPCRRGVQWQPSWSYRGTVKSLK